MDRVAALRLVAVEPLPGHAAGFERVRRALLERLHDFDQPVQLEQRLAALGFQLAPQCQRLLREPDVLGLGIREPEDPRAAVARAVVVADAELLVDGDFDTPPLQCPARRQAHDAATDDGDPHALVGQQRGRSRDRVEQQVARAQERGEKERDRDRARMAERIEESAGDVRGERSRPHEDVP